MNKTAKNKIANLAAATLLLASGHAAAFELKDFSGNSTSVDTLLPINQWTLVMLWSIDCVACEEQKPMIDAFHQDHHRSNARVIGVSTDGDKNLPSVIEHANKRPTSFNNYIAVSGTFAESYSAATGKKFFGTPTYLLYDTSGSLVATHAGVIDRKLLERIVGEPEELQVVPADLLR